MYLLPLPSVCSGILFWHFVKCDLQAALTRSVHMANLRKHLVWHVTLPWPQGKYNHSARFVCDSSASSRLNKKTDTGAEA